MGHGVAVETTETTVFTKLQFFCRSGHDPAAVGREDRATAGTRSIPHPCGVLRTLVRRACGGSAHRRDDPSRPSRARLISVGTRKVSAGGYSFGYSRVTFLGRSAKRLARRTGRFPQLVDSGSGVKRSPFATITPGALTYRSEHRQLAERRPFVKGPAADGLPVIATDHTHPSSP